MNTNKTRAFFSWVYLAVFAVLAYLFMDAAAEFADAYSLQAGFPILLHLVLAGTMSGLIVGIPLYLRLGWMSWKSGLLGQFILALIATAASLFYLYIFFGV